MAGCSKHAQPAAPVYEEPWLNDLSLPVPIQFGSTSVNQSSNTKSLPIDDLDELANGRTIGVFGISKDKASASEGWDASDVLLDNLAATYDKSAKLISFVDGIQYYPLQSDKNYSFYGYYLRNANTTAEETPAMTMTYDAYYAGVAFGSNDILWAKAEANDYVDATSTTYKYKGFNARYIRKIAIDNKKEAYMPKFTFAHKTASIRIIAKGDDEAETDNTEYEDIWIDSVTVYQAYTKADLCVAHRTEPSKEGQFVNPSTRGTIYLTGGQTNIKSLSKVTWTDLKGTHTGYHPTKEGTVIGNDVFLYPEPNKVYKVVVSYRSTLGTSTSTYKYSFTTNKFPSGLEAGNRYVYTLLFHKTRSVDITVEMQNWNETTGEELDTDPLS